jgi:hypothetical protein
MPKSNIEGYSALCQTLHDRRDRNKSIYTSIIECMQSAWDPSLIIITTSGPTSVCPLWARVYLHLS